jgi:hypothetical protein
MNYTPGALRAARAMFAEINRLEPETAAELISRETCDGEMLEALEYCTRVLAAGDISERDIQAVYGKAAAAIREARPSVPKGEAR